MKNSIYFHIFRGEKCFVAEGVGVPIVTQGKTLDLLVKNIQEVTALYLEHRASKKEIRTKRPSIFMNFEVGLSYA